jgi:hypothetical protein
MVPDTFVAVTCYYTWTLGFIPLSCEHHSVFTLDCDYEDVS